jgi:uncharacterized phage protein (TIGR01671 family)
MREILYRGKRKDNGEWVYGYYLPYHAVKDTNGKDVFAQIFVEPDEKHPKGWAIVTAETVGQYTGLKDKNGAKIFEGDIVKYYGICKTIIGVVKICEEDFSGLYGVCEAFTDGSGTSLLKAKIDCQVVGNIYDTPELLKQGNDDCIYADFNKKAEV